MEPIEVKVTQYKIYSVVQNIKLIGEDYYVQFVGSTESIKLGKDQPAFDTGDRVIITIQGRK